MTGWKRETKERVGVTSVLAINRSLLFCHKPLNHEDSGTWNGRAIEQAHALKLRACFTVLLFVFSLVVLYLWLVSNSCYFYSFFIFTILIFLQSWIWYSFCQSFFFQCLASLFHVILVYPSVWATIKHFRQIEQNHGARLMSPLTVTVKPLSLQTSERHFSFLFFLVVKECVWLDSSKGIPEKEWNNTKKFVYKAW